MKKTVFIEKREHDFLCLFVGFWRIFDRKNYKGGWIHGKNF